MSYSIERIELYVRETPPGRMLVSWGRPDPSRDPDEERRNPIAHVRMVVRDRTGNGTFGCSADRLSVRWLDKRPGRSKARKRRELVRLIESARNIYFQEQPFETPFEMWRRCHPRIMQAGRLQGQEQLSAAFASALMERAMLDAFCRLAHRPFFQMVRQNRLGIEPADMHPELKGVDIARLLPPAPRTEFHIRHTVGLADPLDEEDWPPEKRINDGLPETLEEYIRTDGVRYFKVKISGDAQSDLKRLARIRDLVFSVEEPAITLDANEAFREIASLEQFLDRLERELPGLFQHVLYIEQPLERAIAMKQELAPALRRLSQRKPVIIDESDATVDAFRRAWSLGYAGTTHKNCKGVFKSLLNYALTAVYALDGRVALMSAEDLQNLPIVPLHEDFAVLGVLDLPHCERNGHHYNFGLSMLPAKEKAAVVAHHPDLYVRRGKEWFLNIREGIVRCASLQVPGLGVRDEPDWASMEEMTAWLSRRHPQ